MSRPILSRPRTRVYDCNYDKGESYYKPVVDGLDKKYRGGGGGPRCSETHRSIADEIAARRSDFGSRDLSGPRLSARDLDFDCESPRPRTQASNSLQSKDDGEMVYDIRGQRTNRRNMAEDFASEVAASTRRFKAQAASLSYDSEHYDDLRRTMQQRRQNIEEKFTEDARSAMEDAKAAFERRSKIITDSEGERSDAIIRWSKLPDLDAASRARQTKARLNDLESEMEELAERQAKRERRAAALRAFVDENTAADEHLHLESMKKVVRSEKTSEKHFNGRHVTRDIPGDILGSRHLAGTRGDTEDDLDFLYEGFGRPIPEDEIQEDFVALQRRFKQRASEAFEEDLAELRRKRRDLQDRLFDMVDVGAEIQKAKTTLETANTAFLRHATKFDNTDEPIVEPQSFVEKLEKTRKIKEIQAKQAEVQETPEVSKKVPLFKWSKFAELENEMPKLVGSLTKARIRDEVQEVPEVQNPISEIAVKSKSTSDKRRTKKRSVVKRKKVVSF